MESNWHQQWLPFDFLNEPKVIEPGPHFEHPANDNERLLEYQYQFKKGDKEALGKMYSLGVIICGKFVSNATKKNRHLKTMPIETRREKAHDATMYIIKRYMTDPDFLINKNFVAYLYLRVLRELYYRRKVDSIVDFVDLDLFFKEGQEDEDEWN